MAKRVAIVGGGPAGLAAAWEIATRSDAEVTLYQMGWRLGGKLATSRNADVAQRIEEHGIHILFGAYENTFHLLQAAHAKLITEWKDDFEESNHASLCEWVGGAWRPWGITFPRIPGDPGEALDKGQTGSTTMVGQAKQLLGWFADYAIQQLGGPFVQAVLRWAVQTWLDLSFQLLESVGSALGPSDVAYIEKRMRWVLIALKIYRALGTAFWQAAGLLGADAAPKIDRLRRLWIMAEISAAALMGLLRAQVDGDTTQDLDAHELRAWLSDHVPLGSGLSAVTAESAPLRMVYEVVFAYEGGDSAKPKIAAGTAVRGLLRLLLDYRGAFIYKMKRGSETIVTTLYEALLATGRMTFEFFHRLDRVELSADGKRVEKLHFHRQATPTAPYQPLDANHAWPDHPHYGQLAEGATLQAGSELAYAKGYDLESRFTSSTVGAPLVVPRRADPTDDTLPGFDAVVLAVSLGGLRDGAVADDLRGDGLADAQKTPAQLAFAAMLAHSSVAATQSAQLWFSKGAEDMGWSLDGDLVGTFGQPFGNWADLGLVIPAEKWVAPHLPKHVAYLAGPLPDLWMPGLFSPDLWRAQTQQQVREWLERQAQALWPDAFDPAGNFLWDLLVDPANGVGPARLASQWFRANRNEAELYTLTLPGSTPHRLRPGGSGLENLVLAGDWTHTGFDVGAVEAAVMSGRQAARALLGIPFTVYAEE